jgi:hypothetical protein
MAPASHLAMALVASAALQAVSAARFPVMRHLRSQSSRLSRRGDLGTLALADEQDTVYLTNMCVGSTPSIRLCLKSRMTALLRGSSLWYKPTLAQGMGRALAPRPTIYIILGVCSDLWVQANSSIVDAHDLGYDTVLPYGAGQVNGPVRVAAAEVAGFAITDQAYMEVSPQDNNGTGVLGILGLGPPSGSAVFFNGKGNAKAETVLQRIFKGNTSLPSFTTMLQVVP